jgi:amino acid adenylation domain-containing protein
MSLQQELAKRRAALTPEQKALLKSRMRNETVFTQPILTIPPRPEQENAPVSLTQQRVWFLEQLEPGSGAYHIPLALRIRGAISQQILQACLDEIVRRHEALRTTFEQRDGQPIQRISPTQSIEIALSELPESPVQDLAVHVENFVQSETQQPFDLASGPLLRVSLLRLSEQEHILVMVLHHIIADFWSVNIFFEELITLYKAYGLGLPSPLEPLPVQYADYAYWQRNLLPEDVLEKSLEYWREQLEEAPTAVSLPPDLPGTATSSYRGATHFFTLPMTFKENLRAACQREAVTNFMALLAALQVTLARYNGVTDVIVGSSGANRTVPEVEKLIGFFANTLIFRSALTDNPTIHELLQRTRKITLDGQKHQNVLFERTLPPERDLQHNPLFQVMLVLQNSAITTASFEGVTFEGIEIEREDAKFDILLNVQELPHELICYIEYNADLFSAQFIAQFQKHYLTVLDCFCERPETTVQDIIILTPEEREQQIQSWNQTEQDYPTTRLLHELFTEQAMRIPNAVALQDNSRKLTYRELDQQTNQIAHSLQRRGVGPEVLVGLCLERSLEQMIGLLAILKAGGTYVPLDPTLPADRIEAILLDGHIELILSTQKNLEHLKRKEQVWLNLEESTWWKAESQLTPVGQKNAKQLAYVIFTSGSTGRPKGVLITHSNVVNHCMAIMKRYAITNADHILQFSSLSFDAAVEEIFPSWLSGATLVLRPAELPTSFEQFHIWLEEQQISIVDLPTAYWHVWTQELARHPLPLPASLRLVIIGGEKADGERWRQWEEQVGDQVVLSNTYGPTETTVTALAYDVPTKLTPEEKIGVLPIGNPLSNVHSYILDERQEVVPLGVRGELYVGGAGVSRGYLGQARITGERFVPDPFCAEEGQRMYRTGDRVYRRRDGEIVYVERLDQQVKLRGFRIELEEIEQALRGQSEIQETVVLLREDLPGHPQLVAYLLPQNDSILSLPEVQKQLRNVLPEYMLPSAYMIVAAFPLTISGKINRKALPAVELNPLADIEDYVAPTTELEEVLADIWRGVLNQERIGIHHNFFALGGHSLLATQLLARVYEAFEVELPLRPFFDKPTIVGIAEMLLQDEETRESVETTAHLLLSIANLSEDEVDAMLQE